MALFGMSVRTSGLVSDGLASYGSAGTAVDDGAKPAAPTWRGTARAAAPNAGNDDGARPVAGDQAGGGAAGSDPGDAKEAPPTSAESAGVGATNPPPDTDAVANRPEAADRHAAATLPPLSLSELKAPAGAAAAAPEPSSPSHHGLPGCTARARAVVMRWMDVVDVTTGYSTPHLRAVQASDPQWAPRSASPARLAVMVAAVFNAMSNHETLTALFSQDWCHYTTSDGVVHVSAMTSTAQALLIAATVAGFITTGFIIVRMFGLLHTIAVDVSVVAAAVSAGSLIAASAAWRSHAEDAIPSTATNVSAGLSLISVAVATTETILASLLLCFDRFVLGSIDRITVSDRRFVIGVLFLGVWISIGALVYRALEGWSYGDGVSFTISTITTIGYGNITPHDTGGRLFTYPYAIVGIIGVGVTLDAAREKMVEIIFFFASHWRRRRRSRKRRGAVDSLDAPPPTAAKDKRRNLMWSWATVLAVVLLVWLAGAAIFQDLEPDWDYDVGVWFTFATLTTIGYGDYYPTTNGALTFLNYYVFLGLAVLAYMFALIGDTASGNLERRLVKAEADELEAQRRASRASKDPVASATAATSHSMEGGLRDDLVRLRGSALALQAKAAALGPGVLDAETAELVALADQALASLGLVGCD